MRRSRLLILGVTLILFVIAVSYLHPFASRLITGTEVINEQEQAASSGNHKCSVIEDSKRLECYPDAYASEKNCLARGCCWQAPTQPIGSYGSFKIGVPRCFFPSDFASYRYYDKKSTSYGFTAKLEFSSDEYYLRRENSIDHLDINVYHYPVSKVVRIKITDAKKRRYEVPLGYPVKLEAPVRNAAVFPTTFSEAGVTVTDAQNRLLFSSALVAPLIYADQFIQFSTLVNASYGYGIGEIQDQFAKPFNSWRQYSLFARDQLPSRRGLNLYGVHPFILLRREESSYGLFFANSNAMDIEMTPYPALTFRSIGGIIDLYVYAGPTPANVIKQHLAVIGQPVMPPYWALGFHLSRYGYQHETILQHTINRTLNAQIPYDTQWLDIDTFYKRQIWTYDPDVFASLPKIVKDLHSRNIRVVPIVDPAVPQDSVEGSISAFKRGVESNVFIKGQDKKALIGKVWPGFSAFPDFTASSAVDWREIDAREYRAKIEWDGLWIDMNEPSSFVDGSIDRCPLSRLDKPSYIPAISDRNLIAKTICMSASQNISTHYNLHNLYGYFDAKATYEVIRRILPKLRPFILTRSTFAGSGRYAAHWTGDVPSTWQQLEYSITDLLNFNLFGIPFVGADVCGYDGNVSEELCIRWMQLGSFYPFMRNHNGIKNLEQDPAVWSKGALDIMRKALLNRYRLLPYLYTLLYRATLFSETVFRPLFFEFSKDNRSWTIEKQFLLGPSILVAPVLEAGATSVNVYFPPASWYYIDGTQVQLTSQTPNSTLTIAANLDTIPFFLRGGSIIPLQYPALNTELARRNKYYLIITLNSTGQAAGELFIDDGVSFDTIERKQYSLIEFVAEKNELRGTVKLANYAPSSEKNKKAGYSSTADMVQIFGLSEAPNHITYNDNTIDSSGTFNSLQRTLIIKHKFNLLRPFVIQWW